MPDLGVEALRGVAAMLVVAVHYRYLVADRAGMLSIASTGVDLFFVLSGFVFAPYLQGEGWNARAHLVRRVFRIYPLYLIALAVYVALRIPQGGAWTHLGAHLTMLHTLGSLDVAFYYNPAFWSLPPEVEFYLLLPLLARLVRRVGLHGLLWAGLALRLLLALPIGDAAGPPAATAVATVHLPGLLVEFMLGALAYRWARGNARARAAAPAPMRLLLAGLSVLALTAILLAAVEVEDMATRSWLQRWLGGLIGMLAAVGYAFVVGAVSGSGRFWQGSPRMALCALWAGNLSYGVYLLHNAAPKLLGGLQPALGGPLLAAACLSLTLLAALLAHLTVERPMRDLGRRLSLSLRQQPSRN